MTNSTTTFLWLSTTSPLPIYQDIYVFYQLNGTSPHAGTGNNKGSVLVCATYLILQGRGERQLGKGNIWLLLPRQLLIELWHIVIPFSLVACARHRAPQLILLAECCHLEIATFIPRVVAQDGFIAIQLLALLIDQPHIAMEPWSIRGREKT